MAKLKAPLMSLGASGKLGGALVYMAWKGLNCVREYVIPANPKTARQNTQRGYLTSAVTRIHDTQAHAAHPLDAEDTIAYALWGTTYPTPRTWFNQIIKMAVDQQVAGDDYPIYSDGALDNSTPTELAASLRDIAQEAVAGKFYYGTSKTALIHQEAASVVGGLITATITGLTAGVKYFVQFRPDAADPAEGARSGIYTEYST